MKQISSDKKQEILMSLKNQREELKQKKLDLLSQQRTLSTKENETNTNIIPITNNYQIFKPNISFSHQNKTNKKFIKAELLKSFESVKQYESNMENINFLNCNSEKKLKRRANNRFLSSEKKGRCSKFQNIQQNQPQLVDNNKTHQYNLNENKQQIWSRILKEKNEMYMEREKLKQEKDNREYEENCTFNPQINVTSQLINQFKDELNKSNIQNNEKNYQLQMYYKLIKNKCCKDKFEEHDYPFAPQINRAVGEKALQKPIFERISQIIEEKHKHLHKLKLENDQQQDHHPKINETSLQLAHQKNMNNQNVVARLQEDANNKMLKQLELQEIQLKESEQEFTFQPQINPQWKSNEDILKDNKFYTMQKNFAQRQFEIEDHLKEKREQEKQKCVSEQTFKPQLNKISEYFMEMDQNRKQETQWEKANRLYKKDFEHKQIVVKQIEDCYYEQFKFQPEINQVSKVIGKQNDIDNLAHNLSTKDKLKLMQMEKDISEQKQCTFKPILFFQLNFIKFKNNQNKNKLIIQQILQFLKRFQIFRYQHLNFLKQIKSVKSIFNLNGMFLRLLFNMDFLSQFQVFKQLIFLTKGCNCSQNIYLFFI